MPIDNLVEFILFVIPGFISIELYRIAYPVREKNQYYHVTWSIVAGLIITGIVKLIDIHLLNYFLRSNQNDFSSFRFIFSLIFGGFILGGVGIFLYKIRFNLYRRFKNKKWRSWLTPDLKSVWVKLNRKENKNWAIVFLTDGAVYSGWIKYYKYDPNLVDQDFLLARAKRIDEDLNEKYVVSGEGVYLNTKNITRIEYIKPIKKNIKLKKHVKTR